MLPSSLEAQCRLQIYVLKGMAMAASLQDIECWVLRAPIAEPVANAFGAMSNRPAVFLRLRDSDGACGWGEVFSNFPQVGAEPRARLVRSLFVPMLTGVAA